jgi:glycosyltransferase involved in cell wall biosynthesis
VHAPDVSGKNRSAAAVSVIIPAHNAEPFLEQAVRTVQRQTLKTAETIVIADHCSDRTPHLARELGATVIEIKQRNMAAALNAGVRAATQPWIALLDADDVWDTEKLALQFEAIDTFPTAGLVACDYIQLQGDPSTSLQVGVHEQTWSRVNFIQKDRCRFVEKITGELLPLLGLLTTCILVRRDVFDRVGFFDEQFLFGQTMEFFARALARYPLAFVERPLAFHRRHETNHTNNLEGYWPAYISIVNRMLEHPTKYPEGAGEAYRARLKQQFHLFEREMWKEKSRQAIS